MSRAYTTAFRNGLRPDPYIDFVEWSDTYRYLPKESSVEPGRYRTSRTPYAREILEELSPQSPTSEVVAIKPTQTGFTEVGNNFLFGIAHLYPAPCMMAFPTDAMALKHSKKKVAPSVASTPCLNERIKKAKSRDSGNTLLLKEFPGGSWTFTGSNSPASARSDSIRFLVLDDYDGFVQEAGDEGAPGDLLKKRTDAFGAKKKIYMNSTPTIKGVSHIDREWSESSQGHYNVPCPRCGGMQFLTFGGPDSDHGIKFTRDSDGQVGDVWYVCEHCGTRIDEWEKTYMLQSGRYVHKFPKRKKRGFKINALYSPLGWLSWEQIVTEFLIAAKAKKRGDNSPMKVWVNTRMADVYEEDGSQPEWNKLKTRAEPYKILTVPARGMALFSGVDTHDDRLDVVIRAFGPGEESWLIFYGILYGDPDQPEVWAQLDELLYRQYNHASGAKLPILTMAIDSGGHKTQAVYKYARLRSPKVIAVKGSSTKGRPIISKPSKQDISVSGKILKNGVNLWPVGTDVAKGVIYSRLKIVENGPGFFHFPIDLEDEYYLQLTAEKLVKRYVKGFPVYEWVNTRTANHALDCEVYCLAAAYRAGVQTIQWAKIAKRLKIEAPVADDNTAPPPQLRQVKKPKPKHPKRPKPQAGYSRPAWMGK